MKKKNHIKMRFSTLLLCCLAIVLCAAPRGWAVIYDDGDEHNITEDVVGCLEIEADTTVNLYASVSQYIYAGPGSVLNIYSGDVGLYVVLSTDEPYAVVTVYGTDFGGDGDFSVPGQVSFSGGTLTGYYPDGSDINLWFLSQLPIYLGTNDAPVVEIDIKPGSDLNSINLKSKGVVPVAVLSTNDFDASTIDPDTDTVLFAGAKPERWTMEDVDNDGKDDMLFHFKTQELLKSENNPDGLDENSTEAKLTIETNNGVISGTDTVRIVPQKKKK
jgi:hypothetical protein